MKLVANLAAWAVCLAGWIFFEPDVVRALVFGTAMALVIAAVGIRAWSRDWRFLDPAWSWRWLAGMIAVILALIGMHLVQYTPPQATWVEVIETVRAPSDSLWRLLFLFVAATSFPFFAASVIHAEVLSRLAICAGVTFEQLAGEIRDSPVHQTDARVPPTLRSEIVWLPMFLAVVPGIWAMRYLRLGQTQNGLIVLGCWLPLYALLVWWLHRRGQANAWLSIAGAAAVLLATWLAVQAPGVGVK